MASTTTSPRSQIDAVEIDPDVTEVGRELFDFHGENITTHDADARPWLQAQNDTFDSILVDAYRQPYIPFYLTTREFFDVVREPARARAGPSRSTSATCPAPTTSRRC